MRTSPLFVAALAAFSDAAATVQGTCAALDTGLIWLQSVLSPNAVISCRGQPLAQYNAGRYWGEQYGKSAAVVVFPATSKDVGYAIQATSLTPLGLDFAFVSGAHGQTNASSSTGFVIDLSYMNQTQIVPNFKTSDGRLVTAIAYQGGSTWADVLATTSGSGYTAVGARVGSVGVGGFSTGGGIGFLAGAYGYAIDRLRQMEVVLPSGLIVNATNTNAYSDLFWALQGGGGQFGIVTMFWQEAAFEPTSTTLGIYYINRTDEVTAQKNTAAWFSSNTDSFSLMYYAYGFIGPNPADSNPADFGMQNVIIALQFGNPKGNQQSYNATFSSLLAGLTPSFSQIYQVPYSYATNLIDPFFPYGFRRGFYGPQTSSISVSYLANATSTFKAYISSIAAAGEFPATGLWALQYMFPGLSGTLPATSDATAWPHTVAGHQTLFSPSWEHAMADGLTASANSKLNQITYDHQASVGPQIPDYPNYISPGVSGSRVWGSNVARLITVKAKYDPMCRIHNGRVFASAACILGGWANIYPN